MSTDDSDTQFDHFTPSSLPTDDWIVTETPDHPAWEFVLETDIDVSESTRRIEVGTAEMLTQIAGQVGYTTGYFLVARDGALPHTTWEYYDVNQFDPTPLITMLHDLWNAIFTAGSAFTLPPTVTPDADESYYTRLSTDPHSDPSRDTPYAPWPPQMTADGDLMDIDPSSSD